MSRLSNVLHILAPNSTERVILILLILSVLWALWESYRRLQQCKESLRRQRNLHQFWKIALTCTAGVIALGRAGYLSLELFQHLGVLTD
jgi:hypothetical protein